MKYYIKTKERVLVDRECEYVVEAKTSGEAEFLFNEDSSRYDGQILKEFDCFELPNVKFEILEIKSE